MHRTSTAWTRLPCTLVGLAGLSTLALPAHGADVFASAAPAPGQNGLYRINPVSGAATLIAPMPITAALAGTPDGRLLGWTNGALVQINTTDASQSPVGFPAGVSATGFEVLSNGRAFIVGSPQTFSAQLFEVNLTDGTLTPIGEPGTINAGIDASLGLTPGTSRANIFSLGSIGDELYGINGETGRTNLVRIDTTTAQTTVIGPANALPDANGGNWSGFASLTGADTDSNGIHDTLIAGINFRNPGSVRQGIVASINPTTGVWTQLGANPPLIFFGMGASPARRCDSLDFNTDGDFPTPLDLEDFINAVAGNTCATCSSDLDFNNDGDFPTPLDIEAFISVSAGGACL